jgi:hypothetical protein
MRSTCFLLLAAPQAASFANEEALISNLSLEIAPFELEYLTPEECISCLYSSSDTHFIPTPVLAPTGGIDSLYIVLFLTLTLYLLICTCICCCKSRTVEAPLQPPTSHPKLRPRYQPPQRRCCRRPPPADTSPFGQSLLLDHLKQSPLLTPESIRQTFRDTVLPSYQQPSDHSHPVSAVDRSSASAFIDRVGNALGLETYRIQTSRDDEKKGKPGSRSYFWTTDLTVAPQPMEIPERPLIAMVDVDQYLDMPTFLCDNVHPTLLYTVQPTRVSRVSHDYNYTFNERNELVYHTAGGGRYTHRVWNYSTDHFVTIKYEDGLPVKVAAYYVDRKATTDDHELVMLTPIGHWEDAGAALYCQIITGRSLERLSVVFGDFTRLSSSSTDGMKISTGRPNSYASSYVDAAQDDLIATVARTSQYPLSLPQVMAYIPDRDQALPSLEYHRSKTITKPQVVCPVALAVRSYQFNPINYDPSAKTTLLAYMNPLIHGAFAPSKTVDNEVQCVNSRINDVRPHELPLTGTLARAMDEFAQMLIPDAHTLMPTDHDEVYTRQNRPTQRQTFARAHGSLPKRIVRMFMKAEAYPNVKPPRPISIINPVDKLEYSRYIYSFEKLLKRQKWYAFSKSPADIADRVVECLQGAQFAVNTDFSKFDGHGSNMMRHFERMLLIRAFRPEYHQEILDLHRSQYCMKGYGSFDTKYNTEYSRASGSPETSIFNTTVNAFVAFLAFRLADTKLAIPPMDSFNRLGIYGGDDGLTADIAAATYTRAAQLIGQELTVEPVLRGHSGIKFLARLYSPDVWYGDENSICDVARQMAKFHTSVRLPSNVTPRMKFLEKIRCFSLSDLHTPIIGDLCAAVIRITGPLVHDPSTSAISTWTARYKIESQYQNEPGDWMEGTVEQILPEFQYNRFLDWLASCDTVEKLMAPPMFMAPVEAKSTIPVVIDQQIVGPGIDHKHVTEAKLPEGRLSSPSPTLPPVLQEEKKLADTPVQSEVKILIVDPDPPVPTVPLTDAKHFVDQKTKHQPVAKKKKATKGPKSKPLSLPPGTEVWQEKWKKKGPNKPASSLK